MGVELLVSLISLHRAESVLLKSLLSPFAFAFYTNGRGNFILYTPNALKCAVTLAMYEGTSSFSRP
jgi:hypothetical protein